MGLFDGYVDPEQFRDSGGLLGRLLSLQHLQDQYQPGAGFDPAPSVSQTPVLRPTPWPNLPGYGPSSGEQMAAPDVHSQYQALRPILGDHNAMLAIVHPEFGKTLITQALAGQIKPGHADGADPAGIDQAGVGDIASASAAGKPPGYAAPAADAIRGSNPANLSRKPRTNFRQRGKYGQ